MSLPIRLAFLLAASLAVTACASQPASEMPQAAAAASVATEEADEPPLEQADANAQCWMKYDKAGGSLEAKAKLVDKCAADKMKGKK